MSVRRPFAKSQPRAEKPADCDARTLRFRHRFDSDDVIDMTIAPEPAPRPLDRAARRAAMVAQAGYGLCLAALSQPRRPSLSRAT